MGYIRTVKKDEIDDFINDAILEINEDKKACDDLKIRMLEFIHLFDKKINQDFTHLTILDLENLPAKNATYII